MAIVCMLVSSFNLSQCFLKRRVPMRQLAQTWMHTCDIFAEAHLGISEDSIQVSIVFGACLLDPKIIRFKLSVKL